MKKSWKQITGIFFTLLVTACLLAGTAAAEEEEAVLDYPDVGLSICIPYEDMVSLDLIKGDTETLLSTEVGYQSGVYLTMLVYEPDGYFDENTFVPFLTFICLRSDFDEEAANDPELMELLPGNELEEITTVGDYTHYVIVGTDRFPASFTEEDEYVYNQLLDITGDIIASSRYYVPENPYEQFNGDVISFQTTDFDGNPVDSADLFAENEITMLNIWETGCGPCRGELPELAKIHERLQEMDCGIVGLLFDSDSEESVEMARELLAEAGAAYPSIKCPDNINDLFEITGLPLSLFINREGRIVGAPVSGALVAKYEPAIMQLLSEAAGDEEEDEDFDNPFTVQQTARSFGGETPVPNKGYRVICMDEEGNPVSGVTVQFCSDTMCHLEETDAEGAAMFDLAPDHYTVHILKVPDGYADDSNEYEAGFDGADVMIILNSAA